MDNSVVPREFTIPDTIEGVAGLLTARKWEKAAIVFAWTRPDKPGPKPEGKDTGKTTRIYGIQEFADLGLTGLRSNRTVKNYRNAWAWAIEQRLARPVKPGDIVDFGDLASVPFPPTGNRAYPISGFDDDYEAEAEKAGLSADAVKRAGANKAGAKAAYKADPVFRSAINEAREELTAERAERAIEEAEKRGISREVFDNFQTREERWKNSTMGQLLDYAEEEIDRLDAIRELVAIAETGKAKMQQAVAQFGHTGVGDEVELLHRMNAALTDWQWSATAFIVEPTGGVR